MADMLRDGLAFLTARLAAHASQTVTYARGYDAVDVLAMFGRKLLKLDDGFGGIRMEWTDMDFLISAASLDFGSGPITPERGDFVHVHIGADIQTFEVFPFGNEPPWRWSDPHQSMVRVHTKHIDTEPFV